MILKLFAGLSYSFLNYDFRLVRVSIATKIIIVSGGNRTLDKDQLYGKQYMFCGPEIAIVVGPENMFPNDFNQ